MKRFGFFSVLIFLMTLLAKYPTTGSIKGKITDETGNPIKDVSMLVVGKTWRDKTDEKGVYFIPEVRAGTYVILSQKKLFASTKVESVRVEVDRTTTLDLSILKTDNVSSWQIEHNDSLRDAFEKERRKLLKKSLNVKIQNTEELLGML